MERLAIALVLAGLWGVPQVAWACPGCNPPRPEQRTLFLPTGATTAAGTWDVSLYELVFPSVSYGLSESVQLNLAGTFVPTAEVIVAPGAKIRIVDLGPLQLAAFATVAVDIPLEGRVGALPVLGGVSTYCGFPSEKWCGSAIAAVAVPFSPRGADQVFDVGLSTRYRVTRRIDLLAELNVHTVVPEPQVGLTGVVAARVRWRRYSLDLGWLMDVGLRGPAFPLLGPPGIPVINVAASFP